MTHEDVGWHLRPLEEPEPSDWLLKGDEACVIHLLTVDSGGDQQQQQHTALAVLWWTNAVCLPAIAALGLLCNGLNLLVLSGNEQARRMPSWHLLVALALFDSFFLLFAVLELAVPASLEGQPALVMVHTRLVLFVRMFASSFYKASILIVVAFNVERYLCVCRPLWAHRTGILQRRAAGDANGKGRSAVIALALLIGLLCSLQWPLAWHVVECRQFEQHSAAEGEMMVEEETVFTVVAIRDSKLLQAYYRLMDWFALFAFNLLPIGLLSVLNLQLVLTLRRIVRRDSSASSTFVQEEQQQQEDPPATTAVNQQHLPSASEQAQISGGGALERTGGLNANAMLFAVVLLLFICIGPQAPARLLYELHGHYHVDAVLYTCISQQLVFLNASLNFCLYCLVSRRYRALLKESVHRLLHGISRRLMVMDSGGDRGRLTTWMSAKFSAAVHHNNAHSSSSSAGTGSREEQQMPFLQLEMRRMDTSVEDGLGPEMVDGMKKQSRRTSHP